MPTTTGSYPVSAFTNPQNGQSPIDATTVRGNDNTIRTAYVSHDADTGIHVQSSTLASRPAAGIAGRKWITEDSGIYTLWFDDGTNWHPVSSENVSLSVLAGEALLKGDVVKVTGWNNGQDLPIVAKVSSATDTAFAIMTADVANGAMGYATNTGIVQDVNTNAFAAGTILYPNASAWFTATKPTSGMYQVAGYVLRQNTNNGVIFVEFSGARIVEASANTASTVVQRDASGDFAAGTVTVAGVNATTLTASGAVTGGSVVSNGLVNLSAAGAGQIQFPATQNASTNANTLDDYEEGPFTPTGNGVTLTATGTYTKVGRAVHFQLEATWPTTSNGSAARILSLPFSPANISPVSVWTDRGAILQAYATTASRIFLTDAAGAEVTNATMSTKYVAIAGTYQTA